LIQALGGGQEINLDLPDKKKEKGLLLDTEISFP
jgi:hypothetical protein